MPPLQPLKAHSDGQPNGYLDHSMQRHTLDTTSNQHEPRARVESSTSGAIQLWQNVHPHKRGYHCLHMHHHKGNEHKQSLHLRPRVLSHDFLRHGCNVCRQTHIHTKGISVIIHPLHEPSLKGRGTQVQISQQPLQICNNALPIRTQTTSCLLEQTFHLTLHSKENAFCAPQAPQGLRNLFYCTLFRKQTR